MQNIIITGACGFIGSNVVDKFLEHQTNINIIVIDKITYAANVKNLNKKAKLIKLDIGDKKILKLLKKYKIDAVVNLAAETHVDNSIDNPYPFIETNIKSTFKLLHNCLKYFQEYNKKFKFVHISTDEVFGDLTKNCPKFNEETKYNPSSPYSSSKAAADMLIKSYIRTFNFNATILHCTNNFGPRQHQEKFIPKIILSCIKKEKIPIYGNGNNIREWTFVEDFAEAIYTVTTHVDHSESYCIGSGNEMTNIDIANKICDIMSIKLGYNCNELLKFVGDRRGHDFRYAIDSSKIQKELGFQITRNFEDGIADTIEWYINHIYKKRFFTL